MVELRIVAAFLCGMSFAKLHAHHIFNARPNELAVAIFEYGTRYMSAHGIGAPTLQ